MITSLDLTTRIIETCCVKTKVKLHKAQGLTDGFPKASILSLGTMLTRTTKLVR